MGQGNGKGTANRVTAERKGRWVRGGGKGGSKLRRGDPNSPLLCKGMRNEPKRGEK